MYVHKPLNLSQKTKCMKKIWKTWVRRVWTMPEGTVVLILSKVMSSLVAMPLLSKKMHGCYISVHPKFQVCLRLKANLFLLICCSPRFRTLQRNRLYITWHWIIWFACKMHAKFWPKLGYKKYERSLRAQSFCFDLLQRWRAARPAGYGRLWNRGGWGYLRKMTTKRGLCL